MSNPPTGIGRDAYDDALDAVGVPNVPRHVNPDELPNEHLVAGILDDGDADFFDQRFRSIEGRLDLLWDVLVDNTAIGHHVTSFISEIKREVCVIREMQYRMRLALQDPKGVEANNAFIRKRLAESNNDVKELAVRTRDPRVAIPVAPASEPRVATRKKVAS